MPLFGGRRVALLGTGIALPDRILTNDELSRMVDTSDAWIQERTGIRVRHIAEPGQLTSDLAAEAAERALSAAGIPAESVDMILVGTNSPDTLFPGVGPKVQGKIGAPKAGACDVQAGCTGSIYALSMAVTGIASGIWNHVLVIGAEVLSPLLDWEDRNTCVLFGDGAGAVILGAAPEGTRGFISADLRAEGEFHDLITLPAGMAQRPASLETVAGREHYVQMKGNDVFKFVNRKLPAFLKDFLEKSDLKASEVANWIFHQANLRIIDGVLRRLDVDPAKAYVDLDHLGNTSAASVFIALHEAVEEKVLGRGDLVVMTSFGAGMTYGAIAFEL
ncbi:ketoacyl-ACP synthase III [Aminithiophilus ramosus]|uniref:Beta-ketoacyl-[acyl-carrier-protein] synthase III n=1 Tax=Aminithiophilus ramosus TaxID=3029084 RepID=A0A9Q7EXX2_9BACT|nr:beta-ketoacyl-ACP synthase III [Aminithiophilus ramosus]QTX32920.1 ketoacyl-ACP synthase III [Aminithiophilus ramosus]